MAGHSNVPKFGNWESEENVPYTAYFDKARKGRTGGKLINPNDPQENLDMASHYAAPAQVPSGTRAEVEGPTGQGAVRRAHEQQRSREDGDLRQFVNSPACKDDTKRRASNDSAAHQRYGGRGGSSFESHKRQIRSSAGSENSIERSPLHPHARISGKGSGAPSPSWEGKNSYDSSYGTPGRSRLRPKGDESPGKGAAVPKFGEWDESNPASADGYTHIFNKVREEKQIEQGRIPGTPPPSSQTAARKQTPNDSSMGCCFCWRRN